MFHHFHNHLHYAGQGSIDAEAFRSIVRHYKKRLLPAETWYEKATSGALEPLDMCITFDDALMCQYDVAGPILDEAGLTAFWFINTSVVEGAPEKLEIYRKFRHLFFETVEEFYDRFFKLASESRWGEAIEKGLRNYSHAHYAKYPFYTPGDTKFRYIRNYILDKNGYEELMDEMMADLGADADELGRNLWMGVDEIRDLHRRGHVIGLHSHTHPVDIAGMPEAAQREEYETNHRKLTEWLGEAPTTVAHPADSYNQTTLSILKELGIAMGFEATMRPKTSSPLTLPREDHATVLKSLKNGGCG